MATNNDLLSLSALSYNLPPADIHLFNSQAYHQLYGGSSELDDNKLLMHLKQQPDMSIRHDIKIPIDHHQCNLPIICNTACTKKELDMIGPHFKADVISFNHSSVFSDHWNVEVDKFEYEFDSYSKMCCPCVGVEENVNLTNAQRELIIWHWKFSISRHHIKEFMHVHNSKE